MGLGRRTRMLLGEARDLAGRSEIYMRAGKQWRLWPMQVEGFSLGSQMLQHHKSGHAYVNPLWQTL